MPDTGVERDGAPRKVATYEELVQRIIDEDFRQILGDNGAAATYYQLRRYDVDPKNVAQNPESFERAMKLIFKDGWAVFEKVIMRSLSEKSGVLLPERSGESFVERLSFVRKHYEARPNTLEVRSSLTTESFHSKLMSGGPLERAHANVGMGMVSLV